MSVKTNKDPEFSVIVGDLTLRTGLHPCFPSWREAVLVFIVYSLCSVSCCLYILTIENYTYEYMFNCHQ
jgi:hypothetical protein